jgi:pimeloyl-ACP methyl ester carboxylesterase
MIDTAYGPTYVRISGSASAPPLVLLHGAGGNSLNWVSYVKELSAAYRTVAVDNICDYGRSISRRPVKNMAEMVNWLDEVLTALDLTQGINLIGVSYGGGLAAQYALHFPRRLRKVALLAPLCTVQPIRLEFYLHGAPATLPYRSINKHFLRWLLDDLTQDNDALLDKLVDGLMLSKRCFKPGHGVTRFSLLPPVMTDAELQALQQMPILFLLGEKEKIYSAQKAMQRLNRVAPRLQAEIVPGAGHDFIGTQVQQVNRRVLAFFQQP